MVALRKDVKVGLVVGGITLAVVAVYVGLTAISGKSAAPGSGESPVAETAKTASGNGGSVAKSDATATAAQTTPVAAANPTTPAPQGKASASDDVWASAFSSGSVQPSVTVTPSLNAAREAAAKPNEVIQALTNPRTAAQQPSQTASATDPSGSLAANASTPTLTRANASTTRPTPTVGGKTHVVKPGETFSSIAEAEYGDRNLFMLIAKANPNVDSGRMKPGVTLTLPAHDKTAKATAGTSSAATPANVDPARQYVVKPGDSLEGIATALYGERSKWESIYATNKTVIGDSPAKLEVGMVLTLPTAPSKK